MGRRPIAVFGSADPVAGDPLYALAREVGRRLGHAGHDVITGGYAGVMEAASRGAREAGARAIGVGCEIFDGRALNPFLDETHVAVDLFDRTRQLIDGAAGFIVVAGKTGTLAELSMLWALDRAGCLGPRPVVLLGDPWRSLFDRLRHDRVLERSQARVTWIAGTPHEAVDALRRGLAGCTPDPEP